MTVKYNGAMTPLYHGIYWWRFRIGDGGWRCWFKHQWKIHQHNIRADENYQAVFVIAFKCCTRCAKNRLIHLLP